MTIPDRERLGEEIAELAAHLDAATHRFLTLIARFDASGGWADQGALTCAHWLSWRIGLDLGAAREHVRVARALHALPAIGEALRLGQLSYSKVRALTRVATAENEASMLDIARASTASQLERICRGYRSALRNATNPHPDDEADTRWVRERDTDAGFVRFDVQLRPEEAAVVRRALELAMSQAWSASDVSAETRPAGLRRADAFVRMAECFLTGDAGDRDAGPPVEIVLHVDGDGGAALDDGATVSATTAERMACDAAVVQVTEDFRGNVLDVGRRRRTIPTLLRRALRLRDRGCRFPGCTNRFVDGHHVVPWSRGGETKLDNLISLCRRHHTYVHEQAVRIIDDDGVFRFVRADGHEILLQGKRPFVSLRPIDTLRAANPAGIDAETNVPQWDGRPADYHHIVWTMMPTLATPAP